MKKTLLVMATVAALPAAASAAPMLYGKLNLSLDKTEDYPDSAIAQSQGDLSDAWFVSSNSSRLGVRGEAPLDFDNLRVIYQVEAGVDVDGDSSRTFSTRNSYLGLGTPAGSFFAGKYDSVVKTAQGKIDQFGDTLADMERVFLGERRNSNTLNWVSNNLGGIVLRAQLAPGEGETVGTVPNQETKDGLADTWGLSATFEQDALYAALAYESSYSEAAFGGGAALGDLDTLRGAVGLSLEGGVALGAILEQSELDPYNGANDVDLMSYLVSGKLAVGERVAVKGQLGMLDSSDLDLEITTITAGLDYRLGDFTTAYGLLSFSDVDYDPPLPLPGLDESGSALSAGLIHKF